MPIATPYFYKGVPQALLADLDRVLQGVLTEMFDRATQLHQVQQEQERGYGDADFFVVKLADGLQILDRSSGWCALLQWRRPFNFDSNILDFLIHAVEGNDLPEYLDWEALDHDFMEGKVDFHIEARRMCVESGWSRPLHEINLKHPLLWVLGFALEELARSGRVSGTP